jgi:hypothetical protein
MGRILGISVLMITDGAGRLTSAPALTEPVVDLADGPGPAG